MKNKAGIITFYYHNLNIGGLLQSYAMVKVLQNIGYEAEQICYEYRKLGNSDKKLKLKMRIALLKEVGIKKALKKMFALFEKPYLNLKRKTIINQLQIQKEVFQEFEKYIPHSDECYDIENIDLSNNNYDIFVCGSDQIWNPGLLMHRAYFLDFVEEGKKRVAYAVSMGRDRLTNIEKSLLQKYVEKFEVVGVREASMRKTLNEMEKKSTVVLDPTMLLTREEWEEVTNYTVVPSNKYIFCYFLGDNVWQRKLVKKFAKKCNLQILHLPYIMNQYRSCDKYLEGEGLYNIGPREFIALIHNAEYVFTDSFHAMVFSVIFKRKFFVFDRNGESGSMSMNSRILDFLKTFHLESRRILDKNLEMCEENVDYSKAEKVFEMKKQESLEFLKMQL